jgi:hypothetical protein
MLYRGIPKYAIDPQGTKSLWYSLARTPAGAVKNGAIEKWEINRAYTENKRVSK